MATMAVLVYSPVYREVLTEAGRTMLADVSLDEAAEHFLGASGGG